MAAPLKKARLLKPTTPGERIYKVTPDLVGMKVSHQCAGMQEPEYGIVTGIARIKNKVFVKFNGEKIGRLTDIGWLRMGWRGPFYKKFENPDKPGNYYWREVDKWNP